MKIQIMQNSQTNFENKLRRFTLTDFKRYYKATVIKASNIVIKIDKWNKTNSPEISHICMVNSFLTRLQAILWGKYDLFSNKVLEQLEFQILKKSNPEK